MKKVLDLLKKTGDQCVVIDENGDPQYVILSFEAYEKLRGGSQEPVVVPENDSIETINQEIPAVEASPVAEVSGWEGMSNAIEDAKNRMDQAEKQENSLNEAEKKPEANQGEDQYYFEPIQ